MPRGPAVAGVALVAAAALSARPVRAQHDLAALPLGDPAYVQVEGLARVGCRAMHVSVFRPYTVGTLRRALASAVREDGCGSAVLDALVARFRPDTVTPRPAIPVPGEVPAGPVDLEAAAAATDSAAEQELGLSAGAELVARVTALSDGEFRPYWRDVRPVSEGDPSALATLKGRLRWDGGKRLFAVIEAFAQTSRQNDPTLRARAFRTTSGVVDFSEAYLSAQIGRLVLSFGRGREAWTGRGEESLVLSAHGPPLDRLVASAKWSRLELRALAATIDDVVLDTARDSLASGTPPQRLHRMLVAHAAAWRPASWLELTVGETALLSRRGGGVELAYVNPLMVYLVTEHDTSYAGAAATGNNLMVFGTLRLSTRRATLMGELVIDDVQIDARDRAVTPHQLGWRVEGTAGINLGWPASVALEYRRADSYTYMRRFYSEVYQHYDRPLGTELGPDGELLRASGELWTTGRVRFAAGFGRWRRGALRLEQRPGQTAVGKAGTPFPSTSVARPRTQTAWLADASARFLDAVVPINLGAELARIEHRNNQLDESGTYLRAHLGLAYRFRYP